MTFEQVFKGNTLTYLNNFVTEYENSKMNDKSYYRLEYEILCQKLKGYFDYFEQKDKEESMIPTIEKKALSSMIRKFEKRQIRQGSI